MRVVRVFLVDEDLGAGTKEFERGIELIVFHHLFVARQRNAQAGEILIARSRLIRVTGRISKGIEDVWLEGGIVGEEGVRYVGEEVRR